MLQRTARVFDGHETYDLYTCTYCGQDTYYPDGHTCDRIDLLNLPPDAMLMRIMDNGNDAPAGRAGHPQVRHWTTPPYREPKPDIYENTPEAEELKDAAVAFADSEVDNREAEARLLSAASHYAATQANYREDVHE